VCVLLVRAPRRAGWIARAISLATSATALATLAFAAPLFGADGVAVSIAIRNGQVPRAQRTLKATQASSLRIDWSSDRPMTVHLEGYDVSVVVSPGRPATMQIQAHASGRFAVHAHDGERQGPSAGHAHGRGALLWLEVHPR
jgi:hypothetical protein